MTCRYWENEEPITWQDNNRRFKYYKHAQVFEMCTLAAQIDDTVLEVRRQVITANKLRKSQALVDLIMMLLNDAGLGMEEEACT